MSALVASDTRKPLSASREISACSAADPQAGRDEQRAELVAVQPGGAGLVVHAGPADVGGG
jgi:hypothetical protein